MAFDILSPSEQVAAHLRQLIQQGQWGAQLPGTPSLSRETGVDRKTITAALQILEQQGWLVSQGAGRPRRIVRSGKAQPAGLRVTLLIYEERVRHQLFAHQLVSKLQAAGHTVNYSQRSLVEMGMQLDKVVEYMQEHPADVWIPMSASRDILEWFAQQPFPSMALFGRRRGVDIAGVGPNKIEMLCTLTEKLIDWGHRRIVLFSREERHVPTLGLQERRFAETLEAHDIHTGSYSLPRWQSTAAGFKECLDSYFQVTPPTALIIEESQFYMAALLELSRRGLRVPEQVSVFCTDDDLVFEMCEPYVSCISWPTEPVVNHIVKWVQHISRGKISRKQVHTPAKIVEGGTIGPVWRQP